ncbi:hypothetical protein QE386_000835 [Pseudoxanthomonas winnipegensis]|nr:hypothetical protein [Pseudoxanthomonas winnipegensis]
MIQVDRARRLFGDEEPVAAPGDVAGDLAVAGDLHGHRGGVAIALHVVDRDPAIGLQRGADRADRRLDQVLARTDPAELGQGPHHADRAVPAHAQVADVVEEDHAGAGIGPTRRQQQRADHRVRAARFAGDRAAPAVEVAGEAFAALRQVALAQFGKTGDHDPGRFASGVRVDHVDLVHQRMLPFDALPRLVPNVGGKCGNPHNRVPVAGPALR